MSINKTQAQALAEGFLNTLGSEKGDFEPTELFTEAISIASEFVDLLQVNCPVHGGKLAASITAEAPQQTDRGGISIDITMSAYGQYVDKGVKGTKSGSGKFAFKYDMPSKSMLKAIGEYIKISKLSTANVKNRPISKHEAKNVSISKAQSVFAMARAIKQHGIKATNFINKSAQIIDSKYSAVLSDALVKDVYNSLPDKL